MNFNQVKAISIPEGAVKQITDGLGRVLWKVDTTPDPTEPFYIKSRGNTMNVSIKKNKNYGAPTITIEYSMDKTTWQTLGSTSDTTALTINVPAGGKVWLRATVNNWGNQYYTAYNNINADTYFDVGGNIMSLLYGSSFTGQETSLKGQYSFYGLFYGSVNIVDASKLILPAVITSSTGYHTYREMFRDCTSLTSAPKELPSTTTDYYCYFGMFRGCTSLTSVPKELPATTVSWYAYQEMFYGCSSLAKAPDIKSGAIYSNGAMKNMFTSCSNLKYIDIRNMSYYTNGNEQYNYWTSGVGSGGTFVKKAGVSWPTGVHGIPSGWTVVEE